MYRFSYSEILEDAPQLARERERMAFDRALHLLRTVEARGERGPERTAAIGFVQAFLNVVTVSCPMSRHRITASRHLTRPLLGRRKHRLMTCRLRSSSRLPAAAYIGYKSWLLLASKT